MNGQEHYREAERRLRASDTQRQDGNLDGAMHEATMAQAHLLAALVALQAAEKAPNSIAWQDALQPTRSTE